MKTYLKSFWLYFFLITLILFCLTFILNKFFTDFFIFVNLEPSQLLLDFYLLHIVVYLVYFNDLFLWIYLGLVELLLIYLELLISARFEISWILPLTSPSVVQIFLFCLYLCSKFFTFHLVYLTTHLNS